MARQRITDRTLTRIHRVIGDRIEIWDELLPGFGVRITDRGIKSFFVFARLHGKALRVTLGAYPAMDLSSARQAARNVMQVVQRGEDPRVNRKRPKLGTIDHLVEEFSARYLTKLKPLSARNANLHLRGRFLKRFSGRTPASIKRAEIRAFIHDIADEGLGATANRTLAAVRKLYSWAVERGELEVSPCHGLKAPAKEVQRTRFLTMDEVALVWNATGSLTLIHAAFIKMLLLTGQRRESVSQMRRSQIANGVWTIPRENMKGDRAHTVPLPELARQALDQLPRFGDGDLVFTHDGKRMIAGFSKLKGQLDSQIELMRAKRGVRPLPAWRIHDLRRTAGTHIARLGFPRLLVSKILGHVEGGITQIYELYSYDAEKLRALDAWSAEISKAIAPSAEQQRSPLPVEAVAA